MISYKEKGGGNYGGVYMDVFGVPEFEQAVKMLGDKMQKELANALSKSAIPLRKAAKQKVKANKSISKKESWVTIHRHFTKGQETIKQQMHRPGDLARSIGIKTIRKFPPVVYVGPNRGAGAKYDAFYGHWIEFGTEKHTIKPKRGNYLVFPNPKTGEMVFAKSVEVDGIEAKPFMRPAYDQTKNAVLEAFRQYLRKKIKEIHFRKVA